MKRILTLCLALAGFGLGMQDISAQTGPSEFEKAAFTKSQELARTLKLDSQTKDEFYNILEKYYTYVERNKNANDFKKAKAKITKHVDEKMQALLSEDQFALFKKAKL